MKYLSFDLESTGLEDSDLIIEIAFVPVDVEKRKIYQDKAFHCYMKCPSFEELLPNLTEFVIENNEELIREANKKGINKKEFMSKFDKYMNSDFIKKFFGEEKPDLLGKSVAGIDIPFLIRDFGREQFMRKYFSHRVLDVTSIATFLVQKGELPKDHASSRNLAKFFGLGDDVDHTAVSDSVNMAKIYFNLIDLKKS